MWYIIHNYRISKYDRALNKFSLGRVWCFLRGFWRGWKWKFTKNNYPFRTLFIDDLQGQLRKLGHSYSFWDHKRHWIRPQITEVGKMNGFAQHNWDFADIIVCDNWNMMGIERSRFWFEKEDYAIVAFTSSQILGLVDFYITLTPTWLNVLLWTNKI